MFSLLTNESALGDPRRRWTTLASFMMQAISVGILLLLPLLRPGVLPRLVLLGPTFAMPAPPPRAPEAARHATGPHTSETIGRTVLPPPSIPIGVPDIHDHDITPAPAFGDPDGVLHGIGSESNHAALRNLLHVQPEIPAHVPVRPPLRPSRMMEGNLVHRVQPEYPAIARSAGIQGSVVLQAVISKNGTIGNLRVVSGHPVLVRAAVAAVMQWRYRPYFLNGEPIEVETQITVNFTLSRG
jgi:protein TonB